MEVAQRSITTTICIAIRMLFSEDEHHHRLLLVVSTVRAQVEYQSLDRHRHEHLLKNKTPSSIQEEFQVHREYRITWVGAMYPKTDHIIHDLWRTFDLTIFLTFFDHYLQQIFLAHILFIIYASCVAISCIIRRRGV